VHHYLNVGEPNGHRQGRRAAMGENMSALKRFVRDESGATAIEIWADRCRHFNTLGSQLKAT
jgi:hypothetical protein